MYLWNVASKAIEGRHDGRIFEFAPNERKRFFVNSYWAGSKGKGALDMVE